MDRIHIRKVSGRDIKLDYVITKCSIRPSRISGTQPNAKARDPVYPYSDYIPAQDKIKLK